jgi:hypothetical protein
MSFGVADPHFRVDQDRGKTRVQIARERENKVAQQEKSQLSRSTRIEDVRCHIGLWAVGVL